MNHIGANVRKLLPSLAIGVAITLLALLFNFLVYSRRLPARAAGNRVVAGAGESLPPPNGFLRALAGLINFSDDLISDFMYSLRGQGNYSSTRNDIILVAIDEESLMRRGDWPWSRRDLSAILEKVSDARVVGLDLLIGEPDRTSLANYVERFDQLYNAKLDTAKVPAETMDNDLWLARRISRVNTVLGATLYNGEAYLGGADSLLAHYSLRLTGPGGKTISPGDILLKGANNLMVDLPAIRRNQPPPLGEGYMNLFPPPSGVVRSIPLFAHALGQPAAGGQNGEGKIYPSFALEMMRVYLGGDGYTLNLRGDMVAIPEYRRPGDDGKRHVIRSATILRTGPSEEEKLLTIPLNELGEMELGYGNQREDYQTLPAWEVLEGRHENAFKGKLVIVGGTAETVGHVVSAGLPDPEISVAEAHATMLAIMLKRDFMSSDYQEDYSWQQIAILASGLIVTLAVILGELALGMLFSGLALLAIVLVNYYFFFRLGRDVGLTLPLLSALAVLAAQLAANYLMVGRERRFIRKAFSLNVSPSILGYLETHPDRLSSLSGEHRDMTVLFSDIRGFTAISERMTAPDLARFLNEYFTPMSDIVMRNMGTVDKFIGDALMAFWNAPADNHLHARDAARSALDMVTRLEELQVGWTGRGLPEVAIGCGINTGMMFAGYMGSEQRKNYTVMGDNVNIASRLEALNKVYSTSILITESTLKELEGEFACRVVDKVRVSGKMSSVVIHELLGAGSGTAEECEERAAFARVFELYQMREFATAETLLKELVFIRPTPLYKMYLDRLAIYKALPPPADWDGTFSMRQK